MPVLTSNRSGSSQVLIQDAGTDPMIDPLALAKRESNAVVSPMMAASAAKKAIVDKPALSLQDGPAKNAVFIGFILLAIYFISKKAG